MLTDAELLKYKLTELSNSGGNDIDGGAIEIYWEDQNGYEFATEESVADIAAAALERIIGLEQMVAQEPDLFADSKVKNEQTEKAVRQYHKHLVSHLIDCGIVLFPVQVSALQTMLNTYVESNKESEVSDASNGA